jgi:hypothetical protein
MSQKAQQRQILGAKEEEIHMREHDFELVAVLYFGDQPRVGRHDVAVRGLEPPLKRHDVAVLVSMPSVKPSTLCCPLISLFS